MTQKPASLFGLNIVGPAIGDAFKKLNPRLMVKNPVMFVTMVGAALTTVGIFTAELGLRGFVTQLSIWLWFTVLFANFAEAIAEGRGRAQADTLRKMRKETMARRLMNKKREEIAWTELGSAERSPSRGGPGTLSGSPEEIVPSSLLRKGDLVVVEANQLVPGDGEIVEGIASVDESAITGESAPVVRESGGDRSAVTGGTKVLSDRIVVRIVSDPGESFLDRMISLVEGAARQKTPNEIALHILLVGLTIVFLLACVTLVPLAKYSSLALSATAIVALLVCLIPTTIGGLLSAIG